MFSVKSPINNLFVDVCGLFGARPVARCHLCGWYITGCQDHTLEKLRDTGLTYVYQRRVYQFWAGALDETIFWGPVQPKV